MSIDDLLVFANKHGVATNIDELYKFTVAFEECDRISMEAFEEARRLWLALFRSYHHF